MEGGWLVEMDSSFKNVSGMKLTNSKRRGGSSLIEIPSRDSKAFLAVSESLNSTKPNG